LYFLPRMFYTTYLYININDVLLRLD